MGGNGRAIMEYGRGMLGIWEGNERAIWEYGREWEGMGGQ